MTASQRFVFLLLIYYWISGIKALYRLQIDIQSYENPSGRCNECREFSDLFPGCCDEESLTLPGQQCDLTNTCDTTADYCLRSLYSTEEGCPTNNPILSDFAYENTNRHRPNRRSFFGFSLPIVIDSNDSWAGIQFFLRSKDAIIVNHGFQDTMIIDTFPLDINIPVGESLIFNMTGNAGIARLTATVEVTCAENYYGQNCTIFCPDFHNCLQCGLGEFSGEYCHMNIGECADVACEANKRCVIGTEGPSCVCHPGFTGDDCEISTDFCAGVNCSGNGVCLNLVDSFRCSCDKGYTGPLCEQTACSSLSCGGNGQCTNLAGGSIQCSCDVGFTGQFCEIKLPPPTTCETERCSGNGCWREGKCNCSSGFSGQSCQIKAEPATLAGNAAPVPAGTPSQDTSSMMVMASIVGGGGAVLWIIVIIVALVGGILVYKNSRKKSKCARNNVVASSEGDVKSKYAVSKNGFAVKIPPKEEARTGTFTQDQHNSLP